MNKRFATLLTLAMTAVAVATPVVVALYLAGRQAHERVAELALTYARDVLHRSEATTDQILSGVAQLQEEARHSAPCSAASLELMKRIDLESSYIQAIGHVSGTRIDCASVDLHGSSLELGFPEITLPTGVKVWYDVELPFARGMKFIVVEQNGYAAIIHKALPLDVSISAADLSLATFTLGGQVLTSRGFIDPRWVRPATRGSGEATFTDEGYIVAVVPSTRRFIGSVAALPVARVGAGTRSAAEVLVPAGIGAGVVLACAVLYLAKLQLAMPAVIKSALKRGELFVVYQPIVDLRTGQWTGVEALVRWRRSDGEMVGPELFIPIAEDAGLIQRITRRVIQCVREDAAEIFSRNPGFHVAINLSSTDLHSETTVSLFQKLLQDTDARRGSFVVEMTEHGLSKPQLAGKVIHALRNLGVCVAIDDFGTGYSSLSKLESFQLDYLKIDRSFVSSIGTQSATSQVALHIIEMAKALNLAMVAEGVETQEQAQFLQDRGVQFAQGYFFSKPLALPDLLRGIPRPADLVGQALPLPGSKTSKTVA